jgi:hypothetical protein
MRRGPSKLWPAPAFAALVLSFTPQAAAQVAPEPPPGISPLRIEPDRNGVNITTGKIDIDVPVLSVPAAPRLRFDLLQ